MLTETLDSTGKDDESMEFETSAEESDDDGKEDFPPLPSDIELPSHANTPDAYDNRRRAIDLFYCMSPPLPSPPLPPPASIGAMERIYANARTLSSIRSHVGIHQVTVAFATQQKKKARAPIACPFQGVYVNMPMSPPLPSPLPAKPVNASNEVTYATLMNTTSLMPSICSDVTNNHVEYQQIEIQPDSKRMNSTRIYENVKPRRAPPVPCYVSSNSLPQSPPSSAIPADVEIALPEPKINNKDVHSSSFEHIYINLDYHEDIPPAIPTRTGKSIPVTRQVSPPPPLIPPRHEQKDSIRGSPSNLTPPLEQDKPQEKDGSAFETSSNASTVQTVKEVVITATPKDDDQNDRCQTKISTSTTVGESLPSMVNARQRRALHSIRRRRLRGSIALRGSIRGPTNPNVNRPQHPRANSNAAVRHPMITDDRWRRTLRKRRRQRVVQMKLDGNALHQETKSVIPTSDHTYNEIKQPIPPPSSGRANGHNGAAGGVLERAMQFNGALRDRVFSWYRGTNQNDREAQPTEEQHVTTTQALSTSENGESDRKDAITNEEDNDDEGEEEEEEFFTHDTFEDFLLRRRPKSSASTTVSGTSTVVSQIEFVSQRTAVRTPPKSKPHLSRSLPPPPLPPLPPTPPPARRFPGLALGLDKTDVDFIHNILQRTRGDHRVWNRITALKEAYIRATSKKHDQPKKPKPPPSKMDEQKKKKTALMKHSLAATKIRAELEKYDELPASSATVIDDDDYDETCSVNDHHRINYNPHHRSVPNLPRTPSAAHRVLSFVTSIKRRAQNNVQQLQKNFHDIRSRVHVESMAVPANQIGIQRHTSFISRQKQTLKDTPSTTRIRLAHVESTPSGKSLVRRANSHRSATSTEHSNAVRRQPLHRTQSNASELPQQQQRQTYRQHHRITNDKSAVVVDRSASLTNRPAPLDRRPPRQTHNAVTPHRQHVKKT